MVDGELNYKIKEKIKMWDYPIENNDLIYLWDC